MENIFIEFLPPWVETGLQPAFYDKESGTILQQVSRMYAKINELIKNSNKISSEFTTLYNYVHDYFDNLDVQEEVNKKLDDMAESGDLATIITLLLEASPVFGYNTSADMAGADNLADGCIARILGKTSASTGDGSYYKIRTRTGDDTPDGDNLVAIGDSLVAVKIPDYFLNENVTALNNRITEVDEKEFFNIKVTPNFYYDSSRSSHQGWCVIGDTLFVYSPTADSNIGVIEKFNLSTRTFIDSVSNVPLYHGGSLCAVNNLIYSASYDTGGNPFVYGTLYAGRQLLLLYHRGHVHSQCTDLRCQGTR